MSIYSIIWLFMGVSYTADSYWFPKMAIIAIEMFCNAQLDTAYYTMISDVCNTKLVRLIFGLVSLLSFVIVFWTRKLIKHHDMYKYYAFGVSGITFIFVIVCIHYIIETQGQEKDDIFYVLRGIKTREQCQAKNIKDLEKIKEDRATFLSFIGIFIKNGTFQNPKTPDFSLSQEHSKGKFFKNISNHNFKDKLDEEIFEDEIDDEDFSETHFLMGKNNNSGEVKNHTL